MELGNFGELKSMATETWNGENSLAARITIALLEWSIPMMEVMFWLGPQKVLILILAIPKGSYDYWVVKVDKNGTMVWESSFGGTGIDQAQDILATTDGGYVIVGNTFSSDTQVTKNNGQSDVWLIKIDDNGRITYGKRVSVVQVLMLHIAVSAH